MKGILTTSFLNEPESQNKKGRIEKEIETRMKARFKQ
jgi:hypothetical protein